MTEREQSVLDANQSFYDAFTGNDYAAMEALWAADHEIAVIHPGWPPLHGRRAVLDSWRRMLDGGGSNNMRCTEARAYLGDAMAFVICHEIFPEGELVATNVFILEADEWKMIHHHSGPNTSAGTRQQTDFVH